MVCRGFVRVVAVVAMVVVLTPTTQVSAAPFIKDVLKGLAGSIIGELFQSRELQVLDHYCQLTRQGYLDGIEVKYKAEVSCPGWTVLKGRGRGHTNPTNSENKAMVDFMNKAVKAGLVTREDASPWLDNIK